CLHRLAPVVRVGDHDERVADANLGVADAIPGGAQSHHFLRLEGVFHEIDQSCGAIDREVGRDRVIAVRLRFDCHCFTPLSDTAVNAEAGRASAASHNANGRQTGQSVDAPAVVATPSRPSALVRGGAGRYATPDWRKEPKSWRSPYGR